MPQPSMLVTASTDTAVRAEESAGGTVLCLDYQSVAGLIDAVAGNAPARLSTLLTITWETSYKSEMRAVLGMAVVCQDPMSDLGTICIDALQTFADLDKLVRAGQWQSLVSVVGHPDPHACALLTACDWEIGRLIVAKQARYQAIRERLEVAAGLERSLRGKEMKAFAGLREARCPNIWQLYERFRDTE